MKTNNVFIRYPQLYLVGSRGLLIIVTVSLFLFLVKLGFWQLSRAEEKELWQTQLTSRQAAAPLSYVELLSLPKTESLTGYRLTVTAHPLAEQVFLLDNQIFNGRVGYLALQLMEISPDKPWLLIELGFIPVTADRSSLPSIKPITMTQSLTGRLYQKQSNPMSSALMAEPGWPKRIQNLNVGEMSQLVNHPIAAAVLQPEQIKGIELPHPWKPIPLSAQKHRGYALQWFSMAFAFAILVLFFIYSRKRRKNR
ncbi:SURF1 family protein [Shewanella canadensis]|uniref:SURF1-like protein n=1 Tax=Shewanella canadensis TaxID=271096 RepID=A0A3S0IRP2_9GAMM|nr:SURF1 family protein [Shewanella canadensis]RTR38167.1 SURF1 family protein [Shewanella canadensis]